MNYTQFLDGIIHGGIAGARKFYSNPRNKNHPMMLEGAVAGFEACRGRTPEELVESLRLAEKSLALAFRDEAQDYWWHVTYHAEIRWVCNCVSALLVNQGLPPIITPTARGTMRAAEVLKAG